MTAAVIPPSLPLADPLLPCRQVLQPANELYYLRAARGILRRDREIGARRVGLALEGRDKVARFEEVFPERAAAKRDAVAGGRRRDDLLIAREGHRARRAKVRQ